MLGARRRRGGASGGAARWEAAGDASGGSRKGRRGRRTTRRPDGLATRTTKIGYKGGTDGLLVAAWGRGRGVSRPWRGWRRCEAAGDAGGLGEGPWRESDQCVCAGSVSAGGSRGPALRRRQSGSGPIDESGRGAIAMSGGPVSGAPTDPTVCAPRSGGQWGAQIVVNEECAALRKIIRRVACWYLSHVSLCASESERILRQRGFQVWPGDAALRV